MNEEDMYAIVTALNRIADGLFDGAKATREYTAGRLKEWEEDAGNRALATRRDEALSRRYEADADKAEREARITALIDRAVRS